MLELIEKGGPIMVVILLLSLFATVIIIERLLFFRKIRVDEDKIIARLKATLEKGHFDEALAICESSPSPITNLMKVGIENRHYSQSTIKDAITDAANLEVPRLERFLPSLGSITNISTLLGLLGTVTGNITTFNVLGTSGAMRDPSMLAAGIAEAFLTTAAGIIVAVPCIIFYNYLVAKVNHIIIRLENRVNELVMLFGGKS